MGRETKLGLVFVGILLAVFGGLLMKRLRSPAKTSGMNLFSDSASKPETPLPVRTQPPPPTLVIARGENEKPPGTSIGQSREQDQRYPTGHTDSDSHQAQTPWSRAGDSHEEAPRSTGRYSNTPSLLAAPLPIPDVGDQCAGNIQSDTTDPPIARYPVASNRPSTKSDQTLTEPQQTKALPLPYQSGYPATEDGRAASNPTGISAAQSPPDPFVAATPSSTPRYPSAANAYQNPASRYGAQPTAASQPATANRYTATLEPPVATTPLPADSSGAAPAATIRRDGDGYVVQPNDSYWKISESVYGTGAFFKALYEHNRKRMKNPDELKVGQVLSVPDESTLRRNYPDLCPKPRKPAASTQQRMISASARMSGGGRTYTVAEGDTLFEIARHELGKPARWAEIYQLNRDLLGDDFDYLRPGTELILPDASNGSGQLRSNTAARPPEALYPR